MIKTYEPQNAHNFPNNIFSIRGKKAGISPKRNKNGGQKHETKKVL
jgi:hypothetical protein